MTVTNILRHDLDVLKRTVVGKVLVGLVLASVLGGLLTSFLLSNGAVTPKSLLSSLWLIVGTVVPFGALFIAAMSIASDRESGRIRLFFGTPVTKADVFVGTLLSRIMVVAGSITAGFALLGLVVIALLTDVSPGVLVEPALFTVLVGVVYTSVGTAVSAIATTRLRAVAAALAFYVCAGFWPNVITQVTGTGRLMGDPTPTQTFVHFLGTLSPFGAYSQVVTSEQAIYGEVVTSPLLATPTMTFVLFLWAVVPALIGHWWFASVDL